MTNPKAEYEKRRDEMVNNIWFSAPTDANIIGLARKIFDAGRADVLTHDLAAVVEALECHTKMHSRNCAIVEYGTCSCDVENLVNALAHIEALKAGLK